MTPSAGMADPMAAILRDIGARPEAERFEYALQILRFYLDPVPAFFEGCRNLGLRLTVRDVRMLHALDRRRGHFVSLDALQAAEMVDRPNDDWGTHDKTYQRLSRLRKGLLRARVPVEISGWNGVGYKLDAATDFRFEAAA
ncbi:MAG: hypothetical protein KUG81_08210 [Gammaproteobacteria bacterium]|nr:hypothetical protein [Gammaproteobacteria bacterium]